MLARLLPPHLDDLELPLRLYYRGDVVRRQPLRPGRMREYSQLGTELLGGAADAVTEQLRLRDRLAAAYGGQGIEVVVDLAEFAAVALDPRVGGSAGPRGYCDGLMLAAYAPGKALGVGGRYDKVLRSLSGDCSAVGFSSGSICCRSSRSAPRDHVRLAEGTQPRTRPRRACRRWAGSGRSRFFEAAPTVGRRERTGRRRRTVLLKDWDLPLYVEHGIVDCTIIASDVLEETRPDGFQPLRLKGGRSRRS